MGRGPTVGQQLITHAQNVTPPFVNAVGVSSGYSSSATWRIRENAGTETVLGCPGTSSGGDFWLIIVIGISLTSLNICRRVVVSAKCLPSLLH